MNAPAAVPKQRKPDWIRVKAPVSEGYHATRRLMRELNLATVCEEAACPNIGECWTKKHATVMILGDTCTRACAFCNVKTGMPRAVDPLEPEHVATAAAELGLEHIVVTSVDRDDLPDGGASQFVKVIEALRRNTPQTTIEILTPDFRNKSEAAIDAIVEAGPDVYNHNLETVPRLYPTIRPGARYYASLRLLESVKRKAPHIFTKSGVMVGLGEERLEVHQVMDDMRSAGNVGIRTEVCTAPAAGLRMLKSKKFEGIIVDCDDIDCGADLLSILRGEGYTKNAIVFAIVHGATSMSEAFSMGANFVLEKPLNVERTSRCFKAACGLMVGERRRYYRHNIAVPVYLDFPNCSPITAQMRDLSQGGAMLNCPLELQLDMQGTFRFTLPETRANITGACEVAWKRDDRVGMRFNSMSKSTQAALEMWLNWKFQERFPNAVPALDETATSATVQ